MSTLEHHIDALDFVSLLPLESIPGESVIIISLRPE